MSVHQWPVRVYYEDTDAGGLVYYANYLRYAERARTEMLREIGFESTRMMEDDGLGLVVRDLSASYIKPARLDYALTIFTTLENKTATRWQLKQLAKKEDDILFAMDIQIVCINLESGRPTRFPNWLMQKI